MEEYKEKLKLQNLTIAVCCIVLAVFCVLSAAGEAGLIGFMKPVTGDSHWQSTWRGFVCGAAFGILALMVIGLVRNIRTLKDEKKMKKRYVQDHDERLIQIWTSARAASTQIVLLCGLVAGIIAGYFSMVVGLTIIACVLCQSLITLGCKLYYSGKF